MMIALALIGCSGDLPEAFVEDGEWLPGGDTTNTLLLGANAFIRPADNLTPEEEGLFFAGNSFFNDAWVEAPASTANRDGLGPLFNARGCSGCHFKDGRAAPPESGEGPMLGLLFRLSTPEGAPDPVYGEQLQDRALPGLAPEVLPRISYTPTEGRFADGSTYELLYPTYHFDELAYGPFSAGLQISPRIAPHMTGLGLLEAIPEATLLAWADPEDEDGDGISGRVQWRESADGSVLPGRFGWKGDAPTVRDQVAGAFNGDLGITSGPNPLDDCTEAQVDCLAHPSGGEPELEPHLLDRVTVYSQALAVPGRQGHDGEQVLLGKALFGAVGCDRCHVPSVTTGAFPELPAMGEQKIWPYTDLLLHDMGPGLADHRPLGEASGTEWKTPPLWSLGRIPDVNGHTRYLHDGRARDLEEAILWHGGEAALAQQLYTELSADERAALLAFVGNL